MLLGDGDLRQKARSPEHRCSANSVRRKHITAQPSLTSLRHSFDLTMSQQQFQQKADQAKEQSQAFSKTVINSSFEIFDAITSVLYYLVGAAYGVFAAVLGGVKDPKLQREAKEAVNGAADQLSDGAYDIKSRYSLTRPHLLMSGRLDVVHTDDNPSRWYCRVQRNAGPAINDAKARASDLSKQAQGAASDFSKNAQGTANDYSKNAQGYANDFSKQAQGKATDVKKQAVSQGKQVQGQAKQTAQANGFKA